MLNFIPRDRKIIDTHKVINFSSNDYLGLAKHPRIIRALKKGANKFGVGGSSSALVSGYTSIHHEFECAFAQFVNRDRAILFCNGYLANLSLLQTLTTKQDRVYQDKYNHASLIDSGKLALSSTKRYRHTNCQHLNSLQELRLAWGNIDKHTHINNFLSSNTIKSLVEKYFISCKLFSKVETLYFPDVISILKNLKNVGASLVLAREKSNLTSKKTFLQLEKQYPRLNNSNLLAVTYEVIYCIAKKTPA